MLLIATNENVIHYPEEINTDCYLSFSCLCDCFSSRSRRVTRTSWKDVQVAPHLYMPQGICYDKSFEWNRFTVAIGIIYYFVFPVSHLWFNKGYNTYDESMMTLLYLSGLLIWNRIHP